MKHEQERAEARQNRVADKITAFSGSMDPPALGETEPIALVRRDDLPANFAPVPYDLHELAACNLREAA